MDWRGSKIEQVDRIGLSGMNEIEVDLIKPNRNYLIFREKKLLSKNFREKKLYIIL